MTQAEKNKEFQRITGEMLELYSSKNELYGDSFNQLMHELGLIAGVVPLDNKLRRVKSIVKGTEVKFESLEDSLMDLANYSILMLIHLKELEQAKTTATTIETIEDRQYISDQTITMPNPIIVESYDPCKNCTKLNMSWHSITNPCYGCPHYKGERYEVYCYATGGTDERK